MNLDGNLDEEKNNNQIVWLLERRREERFKISYLEIAITRASNWSFDTEALDFILFLYTYMVLSDKCRYSAT